MPIVRCLETKAGSLVARRRTVVP